MNTKREESLAALRADTHVIEPGQKFVVDDFRPEDAWGVARLYRAVYGEKFPVDHVYDPEELVRLNAGTDFHQVVGRAESGDVVGLYALFRNAPGRRIMEAGSWIVHPAYRNSTLAIRLAREIHLAPPERFGLDVIFGQSVCDHLITQKMGEKFNSLSCALEIEAMPPRPENENGASAVRVSLLDGFIVSRDRPHTVFLPRHYEGILRSMYASRGLQREFAEDGVPEEVRTTALIKAMDEADLVRTTVEETGRDFAEHLVLMEREYPGRHVYQIVLPLWRPGCSLAVKAARAAGYFFGGFLPLWYDRDGLLLQKVAGHPDSSRILLYTREAKDLLGTILADRDSLSFDAR